jgi:hypothetical protein
MQGDQHPSRVLLRATRERVIAQLSDAFSKDHIGLDEFEKRVDQAYARTTPEDLLALVGDLGPLESGSALAVSDLAIAEVVTSPTSTALAVARPQRSRGTVAIFSNIERRGGFPLESGARVVAVCGNVELDLREHTFPAGVTELFVRAVLGNIEITVAPTVAVECEGGGFLGSFETVNRVPPEGAQGGPVLRITGSAVLGNVEIRTMPVSARDLHGGRPLLKAR